MSIDIFNTHVLTKVVEKLERPSSFLLDVFFGQEQTEDSEEKAASASAPAKTATTPAGGKPAPTIEDIVEAISGLDPAKDYGKNGKPNVEAIEALLGADITAQQRDQAWEIFHKDGKEE